MKRFLPLLILTGLAFWSCVRKRESVEQDLDYKRKSLLSLEKRQIRRLYDQDSLKMVTPILEKIRLKRDSLIIEKEKEIMNYSVTEIVNQKVKVYKDSIENKYLWVDSLQDSFTQNDLFHINRLKNEIDSLEQLLKTIQ